jgi:GTP diphosphokinase / guanosine-3',5'-bis(diphosphate) 3'-diphosphatase
MKKVLESACFAAKKHISQRRKNVGDTPYINHPLEVAYLLSSVGGITDEDILSAALLHDTLEDTDTSADEILSVFGPTVLGYVLEVSDDKTLPNTERKRLQVEHAAALSYGARLIKLGDRIANLRSVVSEPPKGWPVNRQIDYFDWSFKVFHGLRKTNEALEELFLKEYNEGLTIVRQRKSE